MPRSAPRPTPAPTSSVWLVFPTVRKCLKDKRLGSKQTPWASGAREIPPAWPTCTNKPPRSCPSRRLSGNRGSNPDRTAEIRCRYRPLSRPAFRPTTPCGTPGDGLAVSGLMPPPPSGARPLAENAQARSPVRMGGWTRYWCDIYARWSLKRNIRHFQNRIHAQYFFHFPSPTLGYNSPVQPVKGAVVLHQEPSRWGYREAPTIRCLWRVGQRGGFFSAFIMVERKGEYFVLRCDSCLTMWVGTKPLVTCAEAIAYGRANGWRIDARGGKALCSKCRGFWTRLWKWLRLWGKTLLDVVYPESRSRWWP